MSQDYLFSIKICFSKSQQIVQMSIISHDVTAGIQTITSYVLFVTFPDPSSTSAFLSCYFNAYISK